MNFEPGASVVALYDYSGVTSAEISFSTGDELTFCCLDSRGWAKGETKKRQRGWFPISYVKLNDSQALNNNTINTPIKEKVVIKQTVTKPPPLSRYSRARLPTRAIISDQSLERSSIIDQKDKIKSLLDEWLPTRINVNETQIDVNQTSNQSLRQNVLNRIIGKSKRPVFNVPLVELQKYGRDIPLIVTQCVKYLSHEYRITTEGIFRVPGNKDKAHKLCSDFKDANEIIDLNSKTPHSHTVASVFKSFFQQLPQPLVPADYSSSMIKVAEDNSKDDRERIHFYAEIINRMPSTNEATFIYLLKFLYKVSTHSDENQMTARNLGIVWGPTTMRPSHTDTASMMSSNEICCIIIEYLITNWEQIKIHLNRGK